MFKYLQRRFIQAIPTFFGVTILSYLVILSAPGDPVAMITFSPRSDKATIDLMRRQLGLDQPPLLQYVYWLVGNDWTMIDTDGDGVGETPGQRRGLLRGDLGNSIKQKRPVMDLIAQRIPATLRLGVAALMIGFMMGVVLGVLAAVFHRTWVDQAIRIISVIGNAVPQFWLGLLLIIIFGVQLDILPISGMQNITRRGGFDLGDALRHMVLPVFVLSLNWIAFLSRFTRTQMLEVLQQDYVRTAYAKGLQTKVVWLRHALKNGLLPVATFLGPAIGTVLAGAVIIEQVFQWPGMGKLIIDAVFSRDYPLVMGSVVIASIMFIAGVLLSDVMYVILDPRIRLE
ncbi:MAG: ABC transporter permease [Chloroflexota bacterium]|nr:ABC transporter permease [Chloroflexota bacterium]MDE2858259.1 ABC transporter permease [Chloroflexota bacterium]MDE2950489.1 ABC transporter permease [Chloroflexota bacterium]